jgi:hypothetical protein
VTIALVVKVNDGYVLASDSATTVQAQLPQGGVAVANIYNNANKIFNLRKGFPLSAMTWGLGNIGPASIATLAKDLRVRLSGESPKHKGWALKPDSYTMTEVAARFKEFFYGEHYEPLVKSAGNQTGVLGLSVAGYGAGEDQPQIFQYELSPTGCVETELLVNDTGAQWWGQIDAISRLLLGVSVFTPQALMNLKLAKDEAKAVTLAQDITSHQRPYRWSRDADPRCDRPRRVHGAGDHRVCPILPGEPYCGWSNRDCCCNETRRLQVGATEALFRRHAQSIDREDRMTADLTANIARGQSTYRSGPQGAAVKSPSQAASTRLSTTSHTSSRSAATGRIKSSGKVTKKK